MPSNTQEKSNGKKYLITGIIAIAVIAVAVGGYYAVRAFTTPRGGASIEDSLVNVTPDAVTGAEVRMAVIRMNEVQGRAKVFEDLARQRKNFEDKLKNELDSQQKALADEKKDIEKSQGVLSQDALQRRVMDYQQKITKLQKSLTDRAQAVEASYMAALQKLQKDSFDPIVQGIIARKKLDLVLNGDNSRVSDTAPKNLDITNDVIGAMDLRVTSIKMETPAGF